MDAINFTAMPGALLSVLASDDDERVEASTGHEARLSDAGTGVVRWLTAYTALSLSDVSGGPFALLR